MQKYLHSIVTATRHGCQHSALVSDQFASVLKMEFYSFWRFSLFEISHSILPLSCEFEFWLFLFICNFAQKMSLILILNRTKVSYNFILFISSQSMHAQNITIPGIC